MTKKGEFLTAAPELKDEAYKENLALEKEYRSLLVKIVDDLDLLRGEGTGLKWGKFDLAKLLTPIKAHTIGGEVTVFSEPPFEIYIIRDYFQRRDESKTIKVWAIVLSKDGQVGTIPVRCNGDDETYFALKVQLGESRTLEIDEFDTSALLRVGDYLEEYSYTNLFDLTIRERVEMLRKITAALPE